MSFDYQPLLETVQELLAEFGVDMTLNIKGTGAVYDPVSDTETGGTPDSTQVFKGVRLSPTKEYLEKVGEENVQAEDMLIYMEGSVAPSMEYTVTDERGELWQIVNIEELRPGDTTLMYTLQVR